MEKRELGKVALGIPRTKRWRITQRKFERKYHSTCVRVAILLRPVLGKQGENLRLFGRVCDI